MEDAMENTSCTLNIESNEEDDLQVDGNSHSKENETEKDFQSKVLCSSSQEQNKSTLSSGLVSQQDQLVNIFSQIMTSTIDSIFSKQLEILTKDIIPIDDTDSDAKDTNLQMEDNISLDGDTNTSSSSPLLSKTTTKANANVEVKEYTDRILNLQMYYNTFKLKEIESDGFFETNRYILKYIHENQNKMDGYLEKYMKPFEHCTKIFEEWQQVKIFVKEIRNNDDLVNDFTKMLLSLVNEQEAIKDGMKNLIDIVKIDKIKNERSVEEISKAFIIFILDAPSEFNVMMDGEPIINLQIFLNPIKDSNFDHDVIYRFSHKKSDEVLNSNSFSLNRKYEEIRIIHPDINTNPLHFLFYPVKLKNSYWMILLKLFLSFFSLTDVFLDVLLVFKFLHNGQTYFAILTAIILIIAGIGNTILERHVLNVHRRDAEYFRAYSKYLIFRDILSFCQLSLFLRAIKVVMISLKRRRQSKLDTLLDIILHSRPEILQDNRKFLKFVQTYLEALPQTILQIFIILTTQQWGYLQLISIGIAMININIAALTFIAPSESFNGITVWKCPRSILTTISIILFHFILSIGSKINTEDAKSLVFFGRPITRINYGKVFNKISLVENISYITAILISFVYLEIAENQFFNAFLVYYCISFLLWTVLIVTNDFFYMYNVMYLPLFIRDSWSILAKHRDEF